jgi:hypothetical protein
MPRFYFDIADGERDTDDEGVELADVETARAEAIKFAGEFISNQPGLLDQTGVLIVDLLDAERQPLFRVSIIASGPKRAARSA